MCFILVYSMEIFTVFVWVIIPSVFFFLFRKLMSGDFCTFSLLHAPRVPVPWPGRLYDFSSSVFMHQFAFSPFCLPITCFRHLLSTWRVVNPSRTRPTKMTIRPFKKRCVAKETSGFHSTRSTWLLAGTSSPSRSSSCQRSCRKSCSRGRIGG